MRRRGYMVNSGPAGNVESDILACCHCRAAMPVKPDRGASYMRMAMCHQCMGHVCRKKECLERCEPFEKKLEAIERRDALRRKAGV